MFTFMFLWAPSGLVIYWLTSNVIGIGQQLLTNRIAGPPRIRQVRPPAERQVAESTVSSADPVPANEADGGEGQRTRDFGPPQKSGRRGKKSGRSKGKAK